MVNTARKEDLDAKEITEILNLHVLMKDYAIYRKWEPLKSYFTKLENGTWAEFTKTLPNQPELWVWDWIKLNIDFNPMPFWTRVKQDAFIA